MIVLRYNRAAGFQKAERLRTASGFSLIEILAATAVIGILLVFTAQIVGSASTLTGISNRHQEADSMARILFGRMSLDFSRMLQRADVDYFLKSPGNSQAGNDQMAFYSEVLGYAPTGTQNGVVSLVSYRVGTAGAGPGRVERMSKGLSWAGETAGRSPLVHLPRTIEETWPTAIDQSVDQDYEELGPGIFRFEYFYVLKDGTLSDVPWDSAAGSSEEEGLKDVSGIGVVVAVINPESSLKVTKAQLDSLASAMKDFDPAEPIHELKRQWLDSAIGSGLPIQPAGAIRVYDRVFLFNPWSIQ